MQRLIEKLRHNLSRSGMLEGIEPWVEINVGQEGVPRAAIRSVLFPVEANGLVRAASRVADLPPGTQIIFSSETDDLGRMHVVVTADPPSLIDRAVDMLSGICSRVTEIRPGFAKCLVAESKRIQEWEAYVDDEGYAHDDEGNRWFVGMQYAGGTYGLGQLPMGGGGGGYRKKSYSPKPSAAVDKNKVAALQLALSKRSNSFLSSILQQVQQGRKLSDKQLKAVRQNLYRLRMKDEADLFR